MLLGMQWLWCLEVDIIERKEEIQRRLWFHFCDQPTQFEGAFFEKRRKEESYSSNTAVEVKETKRHVFSEGKSGKTGKPY